MKDFIFKLFLWYHKKVPATWRGKGIVAKTLQRTYGTMRGHATHGVQLEVFPTSMMDMSYFEPSNPSHKITIDEIEKLKQGDVFVDIGANIGYLSLIASKRVGSSGRILSFEPSPREYRRLLNNIVSNQATNIISYHMALGNSRGEISLSVSPSHTGLNRIDNSNTGDSKIVVPIFRFEEIYNTAEKEIALMKIDVEGAEFQVLKGMQSLLSKGFIKRLVIEITPGFLKDFGSSREQVYAFMEQYHYVPVFDSTEWQYDEVFTRKD